MPSAGLLPLVIFFTAFNLVQSKHLHVETEDNSEADPMPKEQVEGVLSVISKEARENYESLNKAVSTQNSNIIRGGTVPQNRGGLGYLLIMAFLSSFGPRECKSCNSHATVDLFDTFSVKYIKSLHMYLYIYRH